MHRMAPAWGVLVLLLVTTVPAGAQSRHVPIQQWTPLPPADQVVVSEQARAVRDELLGPHWDDPDHVTLHWTGVSSFVVTIGGHLLLFDAWEIIGATNDYLPLGRDELAELAPEAVLVGHGHFDHAGDLGYVAGRSGAAVVGSREICDVAVAGARREGVATDFPCAVTGTAETPSPGTLQTFRLFADVAPVGVLQHLHSNPAPPGEDNELDPFLPIMDPQPYLDHLADDPDELGRFVAQLAEQDQGGTWMYHLTRDDFTLLLGDSAGPVFDRPEVTDALASLPGCVDVMANAILGFDQPVSGLQDPALYVAAARPTVFVPTHADAWAPVISAGQAQYADRLAAALARRARTRRWTCCWIRTTTWPSGRTGSTTPGGARTSRARPVRPRVVRRPPPRPSRAAPRRNRRHDTVPTCRRPERRPPWPSRRCWRCWPPARSPADDLLDEVQQVAGIERLGEVGGRPQLLATLDVGVLGASRQEHHGDVREIGVLLEHRARLPSVDLGHHHVEDDHVRTERPRGLDRLASVRGHADLVALDLEVDLEQPLDHRVVVRGQDPVCHLLPLRAQG